MKKKLHKKRLNKFLRKCPTTGGLCMNPFCALGCIEDVLG